MPNTPTRLSFMIVRDNEATVEGSVFRAISVSVYEESREVGYRWLSTHLVVEDSWRREGTVS